ncbi:chaperonin-like protein [Tanacetum coccineum]
MPESNRGVRPHEGESQFKIPQSRPYSGKFRRGLLGEEQKNGNVSLVLAQDRTTRKDPLDRFKKYRGGWNIKERHYWASVAFTAAPFFVVAAACVGCIVLYAGQWKFHQCTTKTLRYIGHQANITATALRNVSDDLAAAKKITVAQVFLPVNVQGDIEEIQTKLNASAIQLSERTNENKEDILDILERVRIALIVISAVMLLWTFLGFNSCEAMNQWVENPTAHTALDDILPCVDNTTAHETSKRTKQVTVQLLNVINQVIRNVTNANLPPNYAPLFFNQSGPLMPTLCNPFNPDFTNRTCDPNEVPLSEATNVYRKYVCQVTPNGEMCNTPGRLTPDSFTQISAGVELSYSLYLYGPFLVDLQDCTFVRQTFSDISRDHCPGLKLYLNWIYIGLLLVSLAVMFSLVFWVIYGRERRHRGYTKMDVSKSGGGGHKVM